MEKNILFIHGLEAGIYGEKRVYLQKTFKNCICPDLQVSKFKIYCKNSFIRNILTNHFFLGITSGFLIVSYLFYSKFGLFASILIGLLTFIPIIILSKKYLLRYAVKKSLENNIEIAYSNILKHEPKVLIGSSWGGSVVLNLIQRDLWKGHTILIAPAYYAVNKVVYNNEKAKIKEFRLCETKNLNGKIIIYHSINDDVIPYEDTEYLCGITKDFEEIDNVDKNSNLDFIKTYRNGPIELRTFTEEDHSLNILISEPEFKLKKDIEYLLNL